MSDTRYSDENEAGTPNRRKMLKALGIATFSSLSLPALAGDKPLPFEKKGTTRYFATAIELKSESSLNENEVVRTAGYHKISDGGHAEYIIRKTEDKNGACIALKNGLFACLINVAAVNYRMFGTVSDGQNDDGVQIKAAHQYANELNIPVINLTGEYWIKNTHNIKISNNVDWGNSIFHIDEKFNKANGPRFEVGSRSENAINFSEEQKASFLKQLKPGVRIIPELAAYSNCLVFVVDKNDKIGFRSGEKFTGQSWAREDFFCVEEHGRIIGDIAWEFKDYTSLTAIPLSNTYLNINGGAFYLSGDSQGKGYTRNGFSITRSRTIIKNQWVGLEPGKKDVAPNPRNGFYAFTKVYDILLENIRLIPYEQDREGTENDVPAGTYGISAGRILNGTFRNVTAEGGPVHWGVFGTNLNKNFKIENSKLNRVDVHFHCWNLHIKDSSIGYRGISVTGGGDLIIENSSCASSSFINFRRDFGAKWDGNIRIHNCRFIPPANRENSVLDFNPMDFDYKYSVGFGRSIIVENLVVDYTGSSSESSCWLMKTPAFSRMKHGQRLFFPNFVQFRNILVTGRDSGVRLLKLTDTQYYDTGKNGWYDGIQLKANCRMLFENVQLENLENKELSADTLHILMDKKSKENSTDSFSLFPELKFVDCKGLAADFGGSILNASFSGCSIVKLTGNKGGQLPGKFAFAECTFQPSGKTANQISLQLAAELGTSFTNCTVHSPQINGSYQPELFDKLDFIRINKLVRYNHVNTLLGRDVLNYCKRKGIVLNPKFISMLKTHHELEPENVM